VSLDAIKFHAKSLHDKLGIAGREELRQRFWAPRDSAMQRATPHSEGTDMTASTQLGAIGQIARTVKDIQQSSEWYGTVLGLPHLYTFGTLAFFDCGGTRLMLTSEHGAKADESILYLHVPDIQKAHRELSERGVEFTGAPHLIHKHADGMEEWMAFFKDPEGRMLAIMSQVRA
jgi:catechol-2,3-dioxygenase